jgi:hypothetical protein
LGKSAKRIGQDWERIYKVKPLLQETFVDESRFSGTCYKAANWKLVGRTSGRGRMNRDRKTEEPVKTVWLYPLQKNWRLVMGL